MKVDYPACSRREGQADLSAVLSAESPVKVECQQANATPFADPAASENVSVRRGEAEHIPDFFPDGSPARKRHLSAFGEKQRGINRPED